MKFIRISSKIPSDVWVDSDDKITYVKGMKSRPDRLSYYQFRETIGGGDRIKVTLRSGTQFKAPFRKLSKDEVVNRLDEILLTHNKTNKYIYSDVPIEDMSTDDLKNQLACLYNDNQIIEQEEAGIDWGYDLDELQRNRKAIENELKKRNTLRYAKWNKNIDIEQPGKWTNYSKEELIKKRNSARKRQKNRDKADPKDTELLRELNFAIRAKGNWSKAN